MKVISVCNHKGGCAKTTTVVNIAAELVNSGYRVLIIDNDYQANLTTSVGFKPDNESLINCLRGKKSLRKSIKKGLKELISFLKSKNIKIAIASSSSFEKIHTRFGEANLDIKVFDYIIGGDMVTIPKPDPQIYLKSCEILNVKPENAIALEDSDSGIKAAASAGMKAILIPDIKEPSEETVRLAYKKLDNLLEVIDLWK